MTTAEATGAPPVVGAESDRRRTAAARELYLAHYPALAAFAYRLTYDAAAAEDVVHEAFARLMSRWLGVRKPVPFLYRTVANLANDLWRAERRDRVIGRALTPAAAPAFDPSVADAVRRLPRAQRDAVTLFYFADLPVGEVARLLDKPEGTVKWLLAAARDRLATDLGGPDA